MLDDKGREVLDSTPVAIPLQFKGSISEAQRIKQLIRSELSRAAFEEGYESFEEAEDFDVGDDYDPASPYEEVFDPSTGQSMWDMSPEATDPPAPPNQPPAAGDESPPVGDSHLQQDLALSQENK